MDIIELPVKAIKPYAKNPRKNDKAVEYVANSIRQFGFKVPIVIDSNYEIVCGHTRWKAAKTIGMESVPCVMADDLTPEQVKAFRLADNKTAEMAGWDFDLLEQEFNDIDPELFDMSDFGFFQDETPVKDDATVQEDDYDPDAVTVEERAKTGDIWVCGRHRIICGDSTDAETIHALLAGAKADLLVTDPPYNVNYSASNKGKIANDNLAGGQFTDFLAAAFSAAAGVMKPGAAFYIWYASTNQSLFVPALESAFGSWKQVLVWAKNVAAFGRSDYHWRHEPCFYGWKEGTHYFADDHTVTTVIEEGADIDKMDKAELKALLREYINNEKTTVIKEAKPLANDLHPTMKPLKLIEHLVRNSSRPNENVLDIFGGSGSTMMVCEQMGRNAFTVELDPHYVSAMIDRWERYTGGVATLEHRLDG